MGGMAVPTNGHTPKAPKALSVWQAAHLTLRPKVESKLYMAGNLHASPGPASPHPPPTHLHVAPPFETHLLPPPKSPSFGIFLFMLKASHICILFIFMIPVDLKETLSPSLFRRISPISLLSAAFLSWDCVKLPLAAWI